MTYVNPDHVILFLFMAVGVLLLLLSWAEDKL